MAFLQVRAVSSKNVVNRFLDTQHMQAGEPGQNVFGSCDEVQAQAQDLNREATVLAGSSAHSNKQFCIQPP